MGLPESSLSTMLKPFQCLTHCKFTARSPCCKWCCGEDPGSCTIDTHEHYNDEPEHVVGLIFIQTFVKNIMGEGIRITSRGHTLCWLGKP